MDSKRGGRLPLGNESKLKSMFKRPLSRLAATPPNDKKKPNYSLQRDYTVLAKQKKVSSILGDSNLRSKLESILKDQSKGKKQPKSVQPLPDDQHERPTTSKWQPSLAHSHGTHQMSAVSGPLVLIPIDDLDRSQYLAADALVRCKLASVYRLADLLGWCKFSHNLISVCLCL